MTEQSTSDKLVVQAVLKTDVGLVRSENQDFGVYTTPSEESLSKPGGRLMIVADGMGGHRGGATASRLATETVKAQYLGSETDDIAAALQDSLTRANAKVFSESQSNADLRGMGTTTSALVVRGHDAWFGHVGDSRIYMVRGGEIRQLTDDHSLVATMVREGLLTAAEAENHPRRNVLQRSLGVSEQVEADVRGPFPVQENDIFILCSDGLHGLVKEEEMAEVAKLPIAQAASEFVRLYMVPGLQHCAGGPGPNTFGAYPGNAKATPETDMSAALERWVDTGTVPTEIIASKLASDFDPGSKVLRTRPLCPYPQVARYKGSGSVDEAANFACVAPAKR